MMRMWLHNRRPNTALAYEADTRRFLAHSGKSITQTTLADLQAWELSMASISHASRARRLAVKSLLSFLTRTGVLTLRRLGSLSRSMRRRLDGAASHYAAPFHVDVLIGAR
ncbi:MAG: site-specific integrase [Caulobacteraceae bacterium]